MYISEEEAEYAMHAEEQAYAENMADIGNAIECLKEEIEEVKAAACSKIAELESQIIDLESQA